MSTLIQVENLYRDYGNHRAVEDVSFTLEKGEVLGFLGPNGAGKSTTMQMICGNLAPTAGHIRINGIDLFEQPRAAKAELGYLPETPPVYGELTVDEYLRYCARLRGIGRNRVNPIVQRAKERCGLEEMGKRLIGNLSKGFQQRVGIAQAILHTPAAIILDEPTVGLDPIQLSHTRKLIRELGEQHGIILSTHVLSEVRESCTRVQLIHRGRLVMSETIDGLQQRMRASTLQLVTRTAVDEEPIAQIAAVEKVERLARNRLRISFDGRFNPAESIAETAVASGWGLLELTPERRSLEEVFLEMTRQQPTEETESPCCA